MQRGKAGSLFPGAARGPTGAWRTSAPDYCAMEQILTLQINR